MAETAFFVGTSGYDYDMWQGAFYPQTLAADERLNFYATQFNSLEYNASFYRMPTKSTIQRLHALGGDLQYSLKAHRTLTHHIDPLSWKSAALDFREAVEPLLVAGSLLAVLLQFPPSFHYQPEQRLYLANLVSQLSELPLVVEFRHKGWFNHRVFDALRARQLSLCGGDAHIFGYSPAVLDMVTADIAYVRLHGRDGQNHGTSSAESKQKSYLYTLAEVEEWVIRLQSMLVSARRLVVYFNNVERGFATVNAAMLKRLFAGEQNQLQAPFVNTGANKITAQHP